MYMLVLELSFYNIYYNLYTEGLKHPDCTWLFLSTKLIVVNGKNTDASLNKNASLHSFCNCK